MDDSSRSSPPIIPSLTSSSSSSSSLSPSRETSRPTSPNTATATDFEASEEKLMNHQQQQQQQQQMEQEFDGHNNNNISDIAPQNDDGDADAERKDNKSNNNSSSSVQVAVRIRPALASEDDHSDDNEACLSVLNENSIRLGGPQGPQYTFDRVFGSTTLTHEIYTVSVQPLVDACLEGYNATILAYGQTGSGKTHTILGPTLFGSHHHHHSHQQQDIPEPEEDIGVLPRAIMALFQALESTGNSRDCGNDDDDDDENDNGHQDEDDVDDNDEESSSLPQKAQCDWTVRLQFLELYGEEIRDLLRPSATAVATGSSPSLNGAHQKLTIRDGGRDDEPEVPGATQVVVKSADEAAWAIRRGCLRRVTASTAMNASSSRSHALLTVSVEQRITNTTRRRQRNAAAASAGGAAESDNGDDDDCSEEDEEVLPPAIVKRSKFHFVDLAGSERQKRTQAVGQRLKEGIDINKGLLVLGNVISALGGENPNSNSNQPLFVPYRDSKLTRLLRGSLGGNHKTLMIACVSPSPTNLEESLNCLRYANRAKNIQNKATINVDAATKLVGELQDRIQLLAKDLLTHVYDNVNVETEKCNLTFPRHAIQSMAAFGGSSGGVSPSSHHHHHGHHQQHHHHHSATTSVENDLRDKQIRDLELELFRARQALEQSQKNHDAAEEELYVAKATSQVYQLQEQLTLPEGETSPPPPSSIQEAFVQKATSYEKEIRDLKKALAAAETRANRLATADFLMQQQQQQQNDGVDQEQIVIERARREVEADRHRLTHLAQSISHDDEEEEADNSMSRDERVMKKYLVQGGMDEDDEEPTDDSFTNGGDTMLNQEQEQSSSLEQDAPPVEHRQQRILKNDLVELTRGIAAKEDLIDQLKLSQEKYASMRQFYEEKLRNMEQSLKQKEDEREQLVRKLNSPRNMADGPLANKLKEQLREKEEHIADLRRKQKQLQGLTAVSSRNEAEISRLQNDVQDMKRKKVDLQKQLGNERKTHATEVRRLQKDAIQKERELNKYKRISNQREMQAQKANNVAKARLEEIGSLRAKYKDTQKKLRVQSVKRGVMAKAGLDPILVGKRHHSQRKSPTTGGNPSSTAASQPQEESVDPDALRDLFDQKVSEVVRKEALVNKLAEEWEEHFCLNQQKEEMEGKSDEDNDKNEALQSLGVQIQYKEGRIRQLAKRLAKQRTPQQNDGKEQQGIVQMESFLFDSDYSKLSKDVKPDIAQKTLAKVLFGMVVRERKRTAALARTASSLDERLLAAEKATEASAAAFGSYIEEQRLQLAEISQSQQLQLLSLMEMVQEDSAHTIEDGDVSRRLSEVPSTPTRSDAMLLVLANERISILASQVQELDAQAATASLNQVKIEELAFALEATNREKQELEDELGSLRLAMKQIRISIGPTWASGEEPTDAEILQIATDALRPSPNLTPRNRRSPTSSSPSPSPPPPPATALPSTSSLRNRPSPTASSPSTSSSVSSLQKHEVGEALLSKHLDDLVEDSDSDRDEEVPDWAASIIDELAFIAKGEPPPALENSPGFAKELVQFEKDSVFDRLNDPKNFTGIQKQARVKPRRKPHALTRSPRSQEEKKLRTRDISVHGPSDNLDIPGRHHATKVMLDPGKRHFSFDDNRDATLSTSGKEYRSVFEKLGSPSHATGTQKQKFAEKKSSSSKNEEDAEKLLDDILHSDGSDQDPKPAEKESVFERLQKTATVSYAVKHGGVHLTESALQYPASPTPHQHHQQQQQQHQEQHHHTSRSGSREKVSAEQQQQQVTSPMDALLSEALGEAQAPQSNNSTDSDYTSQNVFERLTKTTTEAYAKKVHKVK